MADTIRGDGLFRAHGALAALVKNPQQLDHSRSRFSASPPSYRSCSQNSTRSQTSDLPTEEERRLEERATQLILERRASVPSVQFDALVRKEEERILKAEGRLIPGQFMPQDINVRTLAKETVKRRWVEQGIWNDNWDKDRYMQRWNHEEPLEVEHELETDSGEHLFRRPKSISPKSNDELRLIAERQRKWQRKRELSRPIHQFFYQVSKERERMQDDPTPDGPVPDSPDINSRAYDNVRSAWTKRGIWNTNWGILPGMSWKHEQPEDEMLDEMLAQMTAPDPPRQVDRPDHGGLGVGGADPVRIFGSFPPVANLNNNNNNNSAGVPDISQQRQPAAFGNQDACLAKGRRSRQGKRALSPKVGRAAGTALGLARPAKVTKSPRRSKKRVGHRPRDNSQLAENAQLHLPMQDLPGSSPGCLVPPPRRSKRLQEIRKPEASTKPAVTSIDSDIPRSKLRTRASSQRPLAPAKPQGISKRQRPKRPRSK
ncbi:hypothetical protein VM1G_12009 [Cytospora mali]|uniref:Uncharacterized protein n=1 Tax=Cytospora mali TaxID=578113 RepID=A0A194VHS1_CYTMA|nr:hypothetical protein VM1G_12009 [Valsa mali]